MPEPVLQRARTELMNYRGSGMSVMEMSHRSPVFTEIFTETKEKFREMLRVPESHEILFLQGGATLQFAAIPMNLMEGGTADYAVTGNFSNKAAKEAEKYGTVHLACSTADSGHNRIPALFVKGTDFILRKREIRVSVVKSVNLDRVLNLIWNRRKRPGRKNLGRITFFL